LILTKLNLPLILKYLINNIFIIIGGPLFQKTIGIPMDTNYALLLAEMLRDSISAMFKTTAKTLLTDVNE